jgi:hypothetical protein
LGPTQRHHPPSLILFFWLPMLPQPNHDPLRRPGPPELPPSLFAGSCCEEETRREELLFERRKPLDAPRVRRRSPPTRPAAAVDLCSPPVSPQSALPSFPSTARACVVAGRETTQSSPRALHGRPHRPMQLGPAWALSLFLFLIFISSPPPGNISWAGPSSPPARPTVFPPL